MKHYIQKFIFLILAFIISFAPSFAAEAIKINGLVFDNSDGIIYLQTKGFIDDSTTVTKGYLKDPDRIYIDINNAILTTPKKTYKAQYSAFNNIKISQFSTEPKTVRLVFEYNKKLDLSAFGVYKTSNSIFIKTKRNLVESPMLKTVYSNTKQENRILFYEGTKFEEEAVLNPADLIQNELTKDFAPKPKISKVSSKYYIDSITKTKNGIMINGIGKLSLFPAFTLNEPSRLIIDLDDTVCAPDLRNKTFTIGEVQLVEGDSTKISTRETLRLGQNTQNVARIVIQGEDAKNYRAIVSPDSKSLYLTNKSNVITTKMADINVNLIRTASSNLKDLKTLTFAFDDSAAFNVFEDNMSLYLDINNINMYQDVVLEPILRENSNIKVIRLALDKLRFIIPKTQDASSKSQISVKTSPDNDEIRICTKTVEVPKKAPAPPVIITTPESPIKKKTPEISNLFTVVIDAGHGGSDVGATRENIYEKDITLKIAKMVERNLNKKNVKTYMIREKDKTVSLADRSNFSNEKKPDLFVSVHVNSSLNDEIYGVETHWWKEDSHAYAKTVHKEMQKRIKGWKTVDRGLFKSQFYVINHTDAPAILCEIGFISNKDEREEIVKTKRQEEIAEAIADGIYNYLRARK